MSWKVAAVAKKRFAGSLLTLMWFLLAQLMGNAGSTLVGSFLLLLLLLSQPQQDSQGLPLCEKLAEETVEVLASPSLELCTTFRSSPQDHSRLKFVICCLMCH